MEKYKKLSRDKFSVEIKDGAYLINLDEYSDIGTYWVVLYTQNNDVTYFDFFGEESKNKYFQNTSI